MIKNRKKRIIIYSVTLAGILLLLFRICWHEYGTKIPKELYENVDTSQELPEDLSAPFNLAEEETEQNRDYEAQLQFLEQHFEIIEARKLTEKYYGSYAVTDLNHNDRLEIIFSHQEGTGRYSYNDIYEVDENFDDIVHYEVEYEWTDSEADIAECTELDTYYDKTLNRYYYICDDYVRDGAECYYRNKRAIYLEENKLKSIPLAFESGYYDDEAETWIYEYFAADRETIIDKQAYDNVAENYFQNASKSVTKIDWILPNN